MSNSCHGYTLYVPYCQYSSVMFHFVSIYYTFLYRQKRQNIKNRNEFYMRKGIGFKTDAS